MAVHVPIVRTIVFGRTGCFPVFVPFGIRAAGLECPEAPRRGVGGVEDRVIGRDAELATLDQVLSDLGDGPLGLVIAGEAGIGKTVLWKAANEMSARHSYQVMAARPAEAEATLPFAGLADLCGGVAEQVLPDLPLPQRRALEAALVGAADSDGRPVDPRTVAVAVLTVLRALAQKRPVVVAVDDVQWLDSSSVRVLQFAARRLGSARVGFVLSARASSTAVEPLELRTAMPEGRLFRLAVGPLAVGPLAQLIATRLRMRVSPSVAARLHEATAGNPFFAMELAGALDGRSADLTPGEPLPVPEDLRSLVRGRLQTLGPEAGDTVLVIAAASQTNAELVGAVLGSAADAGLAQAHAAGVLEADGNRLRLAHPLLGSTAYVEATPERRRRLHGALARAVTEPVERAHHLALAADGPDPEVAASLEAAATVAARRGAPGSAADLAEQASELTPGPCGDDRRRRASAAAWYHFHNGDFVRARALLEDVVADSRPGPARAYALRLLGQVRYVGDSSVEAAPLLRQALDQPGTGPEIVAPVELDLAFIVLNSGNVLEGRRHAQLALASAERLDQSDLLAQALAVVTVVDLLAGHGLDEARLERALALEGDQAHSVAWMRPSLIAPMLWMWVGRLDDARRGFASLHRDLVERGEDAAIPMFALYVVQNECWAGDLARARTYADAAQEGARSDGNEANGLTLAAQALAHAHTGDADAVRREAAEAVASFERTGLRMHALWPLWALGLVALSSGDAAGAHRVLGPLAEAVAASGLKEPAGAPFLPDEIEALVGLGQLDAAGELLATLEEQGRAVDRPWALAAAGRCRALLLAAMGDLDGSDEAIDHALVQHERIAMPLERARTLLVKGQLHRRRKRKREAKQTLAEALAVFDSVGATLWADRATQELSRVGLRPAAPLDLTATEAQVADLAALGLTNKAISERVFLTTKTVEGVLVRIYRKLGVHSRAELATTVADRRQAAGGVSSTPSGAS